MSQYLYLQRKRNDTSTRRTIFIIDDTRVLVQVADCEGNANMDQERGAVLS